jgi:hypothetical protein
MVCEMDGYTKDARLALIIVGIGLAVLLLARWLA